MAGFSGCEDGDTTASVPMSSASTPSESTWYLLSSLELLGPVPGKVAAVAGGEAVDT